MADVTVGKYMRPGPSRGEQSLNIKPTLGLKKSENRNPNKKINVYTKTDLQSYIAFGLWALSQSQNLPLYDIHATFVLFCYRPATGT